LAGVRRDLSSNLKDHAVLSNENVAQVVENQFQRIFELDSKMPRGVESCSSIYLTLETLEIIK
jgi:hypothetical protein